VRSALSRYRLTQRNDEERYIYFFDTPQLELLAAGIIARARRVVGDEHDSTIKFRPVDAAKVGKRWRKYRDFKIEADASEKGLVKSASFSMPVAKGVIKRVVAGERSIAALFTEEQEAFLAEVGAERDKGQQAKTRWALDYYAARLKKKVASRTRAKPTRQGVRRVGPRSGSRKS
jgi:hypothetical protein